MSRKDLWVNKTKKELQIAETEKKLEELKREAAELQKQNATNAQELQKTTERIKSHEKEVQGLYAKIRALETIYKGKQLTADDLDKIVPVDGLLGGIKNITMADIKNLKKMAIGNIKKESELEESEQEVVRLKKDNALLRSQVPTIKQQMAQSEERGRLKDTNKKLVDDYNRLSDKYNLLVDAINQLPEEELEFIKNIVEPPNPPGGTERSHSYDYDFEI
jgi:predicted nuclease with TOPRIM domain